MIFVTVGTTKFPFDRLLKAVDEVMLKLQTKEELIVQKGESNYQFKYPKTQVFKEIPFDRMISYFKRARVIVTHGGPATIFLALRYGRNKPLIVPRRNQFGEHVDEHQVFFTKFLKKKGLVEVGEIPHFIQLPKKLSEKGEISPSRQLVKKLIDYTESI